MRLDYLLEVGAEEIPALMLPRAAEDLRLRLETALAEAGLEPERAESFASPRRLAVLVHGLKPRLEDSRERVTGPPADKAFDAAGAPTRAALGFAKAQGIDPSALELIDTPKGKVVGATVLRHGRTAVEVIQELVPKLVLGLNFPKTMRWGDRGERFVRPIRSVVSLLGAEVVAMSIAGVDAGRESPGHRFLGAGRVRIAEAHDYEKTLAREHVVARPEARRERIEAEIEGRAAEVHGKVVADAELVGEAAYLVEEPYVIRGGFDAAHLELPHEILMTSMRHHQKAFSLVSADGAKLLPFFVNVVNVPDSLGHIVKGYEKNLAARLADARFFWDEDRKRPLSAREADLGRVTYLDKLGTYADKTGRLVALAAGVARHLGMDTAAVSQAAAWAKCDLVTGIVGEFAELQGTAGGLLLRAEGVAEPVWRAVAEHYRPEGLDRPSPTSPEGAVLAIADKLDALAGSFLIGQIPSGTRDPFGLRRAAQGIVKIVLDQALPLDLGALAVAAAEGYAGQAGLSTRPEATAEVLQYLRERAAFVFGERGVPADIAAAVLEVRPQHVLDAFRRAQALAAARGDASYATLITVCKRIRNIVGQGHGDAYDGAALVEPAEKVLDQVYGARRADLARALESRDYAQALSSFGALAAPLHTFFEEVMVMCEDERLKANRIGLLSAIGRSLGEVADFSLLQPPAA